MLSPGHAMLSKEREEVILAYRAHEWQDAFGSALAAVGGEIMLKSHVEEARQLLPVGASPRDISSAELLGEVRAARFTR